MAEKEKLPEKQTNFINLNLIFDKKGQINAENDKTGMIKSNDDI
ncbi:MAG: hypothetical protein ACQEQS_04965 [Thermodesulfobacteriota bacterium]